jgi:ankyrin repeat protein
MNDKSGNLPLLLAAHKGHAAIVDALLKAGANAGHIHPKAGLSAADVAVATQQDELVAVFARALDLTEAALRSRAAQRLAKWRSQIEE